MSLFGYPDKKPTNRFCLNPTGKPSTPAKEKPVFIEYEPPHAGEYRPFHHARLVVGAPGADKVLAQGSQGWVYDRYGAKQQPQLSPVRKERYGGLPQGWKFKFMGWSNLTDKGIQDRVDGVWVEYELTGKTEYSLWSNNCQHYAKEVASGIVTREA